MNFWQKTKRFLSPMAAVKKVVFLQFFLHVVYFGGTLIPMILLITLRDGEISFNPFFVYGIGGYVIVSIIVTRILREYYWAIPGYSYEKILTKKYSQKINLMDNLAYERFGTGRILSIFEKGISVWSGELVNIMPFVVKFGLVSCFVFWRMYNIGWAYLLILSGLSGLILLWIIRNNIGALYWKKSLKEAETVHTRRLVKIFMSKFEILQNQQYRQESSLLSENVEYRLGLAEKRNKYLSLMYDVPYFGFLILIVGIYFTAYFGYIALEQGVLLELVGVSLLAQTLLLPFVDHIKDVTKQFPHIEKLWDFIDNTPEIEGYDVGEKFTYKKGNFDLQNLHFSYHAPMTKGVLMKEAGGLKNFVFKDFNLKIQGGKKTAIVGRSGSGKTTLMKLLAGYMRPTSGKLKIDGQDITDIRLDSYYPHIGYLTQEPSVFDGTIEENLLYGAKKKPSQKDIEKAIKLSECQFIYELEHGLQTEIGERGVRLSGGQKQRLAIAKIFLKDPEIILLDEPTAALDSYSEQKVAKAFEHLFEGRTVIVIAHRLQTVKSADDIIVLEQGRIAERGTHKQLLKLGGKYAGMVDLQSGVVREEEE